jgi:hypothetical protein
MSVGPAGTPSPIPTETSHFPTTAPCGVMDLLSDEFEWLLAAGEQEKIKSEPTVILRISFILNVFASDGIMIPLQSEVLL